MTVSVNLPTQDTLYHNIRSWIAQKELPKRSYYNFTATAEKPSEPLRPHDTEKHAKWPVLPRAAPTTRTGPPTSRTYGVSRRALNSLY
ncbi:hypothetical protein PG984_011669 [Apiospora sp. TS-2023a]